MSGLLFFKKNRQPQQNLVSPELSYIDANNKKALDKRAGLPARNNFIMSELSKLPPYFGWVDCAGFKMLLGGNDDGVALRYFWNGGYEKKTMKIWARLARKSAYVIDIGAHTGSYTLLARSVSNKSKIISLEPYNLNYSRLMLNIKSNGYKNISAFMLAASSKNGNAEFSINTTADFYTSGGKLGSSGKYLLNVETIRMDDFLKKIEVPEIDIMKIDVEGAESLVIEGMQKTLKDSMPVLFLECISQKSSSKVADFLLDLGYSFFEVNDETGAVVKVPTLQVRKDNDGNTLKATINRVAISESSKLYKYFTKFIN